MTTNLPKSRQEYLRKLLDMSNREAAQAVERIVRNGGPESEFLAYLISKPVPGPKDSPENKSKGPVSTK